MTAFHSPAARQRTTIFGVPASHVLLYTFLVFIPALLVLTAQLLSTYIFHAPLPPAVHHLTPGR